MTRVAQDLRFALRQLRRSPGFAVTAVLTLALGIGANTAIFSLLDQALLRSLPVRDPGQLVMLRGTGTVWEGHSSSHGTGEDASFSYPMYRDLLDHDAAFSGVLATAPTGVDLLRGGESREIDAEIVSGNYFTLLGVSPALGRLFTQSEDQQADAHPVVVLSYDFWRTGLNGDNAVIGSTVLLNRHPFQVIGVANSGFRSAVWGETPSVFVPMSMLNEIVPGVGRRLTDHTDRWMNLLARLKPGVTAEQAAAQSAPLWHALRAEELKALGTRSPHFVDEFLMHSRLVLEPAARGLSYDRQTYQAPLLAMMAMATLVLLLAVVNVGSLLLVRAAGRVREFGMRRALGAAPARIVGQLLTEGLLIGAGGGLLGLLLAPVAIRVIVARLAGVDGVTPFSTQLDGRILLFTFAVAVGFSLLFSLAPLLQLRRLDMSAVTRESSGTASSSGMWLRRIVVGLQVGLSLLLLVSAGLFVRTLRDLRAQNVGFRTDHLAVFGISPRLTGYAPERVPLLENQLLNALAAEPGVESVGATNDPELAGNDHGDNITLEHYTAAAEEEINPEKANVTTGYFTAMEVPLAAGRLFTAADDGAHPRVAIVNEKFALHYFGSAQKAVGQRLMDGSSNHPDFNITIVGVVGDIRHHTVREPAPPSLYLPALQATKGDLSRELYFYVRGHVAVDSLFAGIRRTVAGVDANLAVAGLRTMDEQIDGALLAEREIAFLATTFAVLAALLTGVGLYGALAFSTAQRTREIGVRMALGASRKGVTWLVLADVLKMTLGGVLVSVPVAVLLAHFVQAQLYGITASDPASLAAASTFLALVALLAAVIPAHRAASVDPTEALRTE